MENPFSDPPSRPTPKSSRSSPQVHDSHKHNPHLKRAQTQDNAVEQKQRSSKSRSKKGSQHADVIDRLDFTGVGPMFHHDGPFDACAPSRNRHRNKAPMMAWTNPEDSHAADTSPYPSPNAYGSYPEPPSRKKVDAIAEAWGIHEPEPYEEFFAGGGTRQEGSTPASSIYNGKEKESRSRPRQPPKKTALPPPQPIFASDSMDANDPTLADDMPGSGTPKRSKSLMQRIRKMRDAPNVPVAYDESSPYAEDGSRPTHRSQNSFLGKFSKDGRAKDPSISPTAEKPESYVYIEPHSPARKELPASPSSSTEGHFDPTAYGGVGRKTSIMRKMGKVVRGR